MTATMFDTPSELLEDAASLLLDAAKHLRRLPHEQCYGANLDEDKDFSTDIVLSSPAWPDGALWALMNRARQAAKIAEYITHLIND